jgi:hypothetical protein
MANLAFDTSFSEEFNTDSSSIEKNEDLSNYDEIENILDEITNKSNKNMTEYITKYISKEEKLFIFDSNGSTKNTVNLNKIFLTLHSDVLFDKDDDEDDTDDINTEKIMLNDLFKPIKELKYNNLIEKRNRILRKRFIILQERIIKSDIRRKIEEDTNSKKTIFQNIYFKKFIFLGSNILGFAGVFYIKAVIISQLTNPITWIGLASNVYKSPFYFQMFCDLLECLKIFNPSEILQLKTLFNRFKDDPINIELLKNKNYTNIDLSIENVFNNEDLDTNNNLDTNTSAIDFFKYIKDVLNTKNIYNNDGQLKETNFTNLDQNFFISLFSFYNSPYGNMVLTTLKLVIDINGYIGTNEEFFSNYKDANPILLYKGIVLNSINSLSFNRYNQIFVQNIIQKLLKNTNATDLFMFEIPILGITPNELFVTTVEQFLNIQIKSTVKGFFIKLEKEVNYDPDAEKKKIEKEKNNNIDSVIEEMQKRGKKIDSYKNKGYSNEQISRILNKPNRQNNYNFFISKYIKEFYNFFQDLKDDPYVLFDTFINFSFIFNAIFDNYYAILVGGSVLFSQKLVLEGWLHMKLADLPFISLNEFFNYVLGDKNPFEITPINLIIQFIQFNYGGSDSAIYAGIEQLRVKLINSILSDFQIFLSEAQEVFFDSSLGMSLNKYLTVLNNTMISKILKMSLNITRGIFNFAVNYALIPQIRRRMLNIVPTLDIPIIETLKDKNKCTRLFTFINNKISNLCKTLNIYGLNNLTNEEILQKLHKDFSEIGNINNIIAGTVVQYLAADGYYEWIPRLGNPFKGNVIKIIPTTTSNKKDNFKSYTSDIQSKSSNIEKTYVIVDTDNENLGNFEIVDLNEAGELLKQIFDSEDKTNVEIQDAFKYNYLSNFKKETGDIIEDYSINNILYYYYYNLFIKETGKDDNYNLSSTENQKEFKTYLLTKYNYILNERLSVNTDGTLKDPNYNGVEFAIINDILLSLKTRFSESTSGSMLGYITGQSRISQSEVIKDLRINNFTLDYLTKFINFISTSKIQPGTFNPLDYKLKSTTISKSELIYNNAYFGINLKHDYGFSPQILNTKDFFNTGELLQSLNTDADSMEINQLEKMILQLETAAEKDATILFKLKELNALYVQPLQQLTNYFKALIDDFKSAFCNEYTEATMKENNISFKHLSFDYNKFYDIIYTTLEQNSKLKEIVKNNIISQIKNPIIINYLKDFSEIQYKCEDIINGTKTTIYLNKNGIDFNTGDIANEACIIKQIPLFDIDAINKMSDTDIEKYKEDFLHILLRPEIIFQLSEYASSIDYTKTKEDYVTTWQTLQMLVSSETETTKQLNDYDKFFEFFNDITKNGIKNINTNANTDTKLSNTVFDFITDTIDYQEKIYKETQNNPDKTQPDETESYKLNILFNFNTILTDMKKRFVDPNIKNAFVKYFSQKEDFLDKSQLLSKQKNDVKNIIKDIKFNCTNKLNTTNLVKNLKQNYFDKDDINGKINLSTNKSDYSIIQRDKLDPGNDSYFTNKLLEFSTFTQTMNDMRQTIFEQENTFDNICNKIGNLDTYSDKRDEWYTKQLEIYKIYILHNTQNYYSHFAERYQHFKDDVDKIINDYNKNVSILYSDLINNQISKNMVGMTPLEIKSTESKPYASESKPSKSESKPAESKFTGIAALAQQEVQQQQQLNRQTIDKKIINEQIIENEGLANEIANEQATTEELKQQNSEAEELGLENSLTTEEKISQKEGLIFGGNDDNLNIFSNFLGGLINMLPNQVHTDNMNPSTTREIEQPLKKEQKLQNSIQMCETTADFWYIRYANGKYTATGSISPAEMNGCKEENGLLWAAKNINYIIIKASESIAASLQRVVTIGHITKGLGIAGKIFSAVLYVFERYSKCFIYIVHDVLYKYFEKSEMRNKIFNNSPDYPNLGEKLIFSFWVQMINSLKDSEEMAKIDRKNTNCQKELALIYPIDVINLEINSYAVINSIDSGSANRNLPGYINIGQKDEDGINYSDNSQLLLALSTLLNENEIKSYEIFIKKTKFTCKDLKTTNKQILKYVIYSLFKNPEKNLMYTYASCFIFNEPNIAEIFNNPSYISALIGLITNMLYNSRTFITNFITLFTNIFLLGCENSNIRPFLLTKIFGSKSKGMNINLTRDLVDNAFNQAEKYCEKHSISFTYYLETSVCGIIGKFVFTIINALMANFLSIFYYHNKKVYGLSGDIFSQFKICEANGNCSLEDIKILAKKAIIDIQTVKFNHNDDYFFDNLLNQKFDLDNQINDELLEKIIHNAKFSDFELNKIDADSTADQQSEEKQVIFSQYKQILMFYYVEKKYNDEIVKFITSKTQKGKNNDMEYRVNNYEDVKKIKKEQYDFRINPLDNTQMQYSKDKKIWKRLDLTDTFEKHLLKPCLPEELLIFFEEKNAENKYSFQVKCVSFTEFNPNYVLELETENYKIENVFTKQLENYKKTKAILPNTMDLFKNIRDICGDAECDAEFNTKIDENSTNLLGLLVGEKNEEANKLIYDSFGLIQTELDRLKTKYLQKINDNLDVNKEKQAELVNKQAELVNKQTELVNKQTELVNKQTELALETEIDNLKSEIKNINSYINITNKLLTNKLIENEKYGELNVQIEILDGTIKKYIEKNLKIKSSEVIEKEFILNEMNKNNTSEYFAFLYFKLFSISNNNPDIFNLFELFNGDLTSIDKLTINGLKYYIQKPIEGIDDNIIESINNKILGNQITKEEINTQSELLNSIIDYTLLNKIDLSELDEQKNFLQDTLNEYTKEYDENKKINETTFGSYGQKIKELQDAIKELQDANSIETNEELKISLEDLENLENFKIDLKTKINDNEYTYLKEKEKQENEIKKINTNIQICNDAEIDTSIQSSEETFQIKTQLESKSDLNANDINDIKNKIAINLFKKLNQLYTSLEIETDFQKKFIIEMQIKNIKNFILNITTIKESILNQLKFLISKNKKTQYKYTNTLKPDFYMKINDVYSAKITTGIQMYEEFYKNGLINVQPYDKGIDEKEEEGKKFTTQKKDLETQIIADKATEQTIRGSLSSDEKAKLKKIDDFTTQIKDIKLEVDNLYADILKVDKEYVKKIRDAKTILEDDFNVLNLELGKANKDVKEKNDEIQKTLQDSKDEKLDKLKETNNKIQTMKDKQTTIYTTKYTKLVDDDQEKFDAKEKAKKDDLATAKTALSDLQINSVGTTLIELKEYNEKVKKLKNEIRNLQNKNFYITPGHLLTDKALKEAQKDADYIKLQGEIDAEQNKIPGFWTNLVKTTKEIINQPGKSIWNTVASVVNRAGLLKMDIAVLNKDTQIVKVLNDELQNLTVEKNKIESTYIDKKTEINVFNQYFYNNLEGFDVDNFIDIIELTYKLPSIVKDINLSDKVPFIDTITDANGKINFGMVDLRKDMDDKKKELDNAIKDKKTAEIDAAKLNSDKLKEIKKLQKNIQDNENLIKQIIIAYGTRTKQIDDAYKSLLQQIETHIKNNLIYDLSDFGYSIKMKNKNNKIGLYKNGRETDIIQYTFENTYITEVKREVGLDNLLLNTEENFLVNKIQNELPTIILNYEVDETVPETIQLPEDIKKDMFSWVKDYTYGSQFVNKVKEARISKMITSQYTSLKDKAGNDLIYNGKKMWVMKNQIKLFEDTFLNFNIDDFSVALHKNLIDKETYLTNLLGKVKKVSSLTPDTYYITAFDNNIGTEFNYFDELIINGINTNQNTIKELRNPTDKNLLYEKNILDLIPLNMYQLNIYNTLFDFTLGKQENSYIFDKISKM